MTHPSFIVGLSSSNLSESIPPPFGSSPLDPADLVRLTCADTADLATEDTSDFANLMTRNNAASDASEAAADANDAVLVNVGHSARIPNSCRTGLLVNSIPSRMSRLVPV